MRNPIARSFGIGLLTIAVWALGQIVYIIALCPPHRAWERTRRGESQVVVDSGEGVARPGDAIFACDTPHQTGSIQWHRDLDCYCAPSTVGSARLSAIVNGSCVVDKSSPGPRDDWGACRFARCTHHVDF